MRCIRCKKPVKPDQEFCKCGDRLIPKPQEIDIIATGEGTIEGKSGASK